MVVEKEAIKMVVSLGNDFEYMGSDVVAMNFVKIDDEREYIFDPMAAPGELIPSDATASHIECDGSPLWPM
ncbi:hypothetical protein DEO72_LG8g1790 [Vigna unguiculata]|uniref:Uncharacterized protein n=1 Tax=Vigna unguiculata TaxID=3917 RepID=A0A4D6MSK6_VIGUN|nr:hypothetical protein DEO72_LG8g1790 [Vigna unguiculata]